MVCDCIHGKRFYLQAQRYGEYRRKTLNVPRKCCRRKAGGGILVISEGVFGMRGEQGRLKRDSSY